MAYLTEGFRPFRSQLRLEGGVENTTTSSNITLDGKSSNLQAIDPTAAMSVTLPPEAESNGLVFWFSNTGSAGFAATVLTSAPAVVTVLADGEGALVACDGTTWSVLGGGHFQPGINIETLTGGKGLGAGEAQYQRLDPGGANRLVSLPSAATVPGATFHFSNFADAAEDLDIGGVVTINQNEAVRIVSDGLNWQHTGVYTIALT